MMRLFFKEATFGALLAMAGLAQAENQAVYYVDPALGSDANTGALADPFQTMEMARDTVRTMNTSMTGDIVIYLRGGVYSLSETLVLGAQDSGTNGHRVVYRNYPHEAPIITGGGRISEWTDVGGGIYAANADSMEFNQLSVNGRPAQRARHPEYGSPYKIISTDPFNQRIRINLAEIQDWSGNLNRMEMVIASSFTSSRLRIDNYVVSDEMAFVTPKDPERAAYWGWLDGPLEGTPSYYFENHIDFLDSPGEWFLDIDTDTVYYMPKVGENMATADVCAPQLERLLQVEDAEYLTFFGLTFENASWLAPMNQGMVQRQGSMEVLASYDETNGWSTNQFNVVPVATYFKQINHVRIERCVFTKMGAAAMGFDTGTNNNTVVGNVFSEIAESGIIYDMDNFRFATGDTLSSLDTFDSNYFFRIGTLYFGGTGLFAFWPDQITITHNEFAQINGLGLNVGWGATSDPVATKQPVVTHNRMHDVSVRARDSGAIHTKSNQSGAYSIETGGLYSRNWIYNSTPRTWWDTGPVRASHGVYLDDNSEYATVSHNVFMNIHDTDIKIKGTTHAFIDNGSQNQTTKDESGIRDGYLDIKGFWRGGAIGRNLDPGEAYTGASSDSGVLFADDFDSVDIGSQPVGYTLDQSGGVIEAVNVPANGNHSIRMRDTNSSNSAGTSLSRSIAGQSGVLTCTFRMKAGQTTNSMFFFLSDSAGGRACQIGFSGNGNLRYYYQSGSYTDIASYSVGTWYTFHIEADVEKQVFSVWINDALVLGDCMFYEPTGNFTTIRLTNSFSTGFFDLDYLTVESDGVASSSQTTHGTPYLWMDQYFDTTGWTLADYELQDDLDGDNDGVKAWEEFRAGTNPNDGTSVLKVLSMASDANTFSFSWKTLRDRKYTIQSSSSLSSGDWADVTNAGFVDLQGDGGLKQFTTNVTENRRFYRLSADLKD